MFVLLTNGRNLPLLALFNSSIGLPVHPNGARRFPDMVFRPTSGALLREFENRFQAKNAALLGNSAGIIFILEREFSVIE